MADGSRAGNRVVIIGGGFGGLAAARALARDGMQVTLVDRNNFHTFQPLLYQVATAGLDAENIAASLRGVFKHMPTVDFRWADVTDVDLDAGRVRAQTPGDPLDLPYDWLVVAAGAVSASFGIPGVEEHALGLKSLADAVHLRSHVLRQFEAAAADPSRIDDGALTVAVVGGGPTGVELAGALMELFHHVLAKDFQHLDVARARVVLIEAAPHLLGPFSPPSRKLAYDTLASRGIEVRLDTPVASVDERGVQFKDGTQLTAGTVVWVAGVRPAPLAARLGVPLSRDGRVIVDTDLRIPDHDNAFVIGDLAAGWPQLAPVAMQQGRHAVRQIHRLRHERPTRPFRYRDKGTMATIGRGAAVAELPLGVHFSGFVAWLLWLFLHLVTLVGFRNRAVVLLNWAWNYLTYDRGARLIVDE
jgi:NADH dehydrogenase